jgi:acyl-CoA reductase-like NAD-dependent aldehyde dehydrogenase
MKNRLVYLFAVVALVLALSFPVVAPAAPPAPKPQPSPAAAPAPERHHHIHEAIDALRAARADLMAADHDFGGHRVEAVGAIDASIHQLEICLQYDK